MSKITNFFGKVLGFVVTGVVAYGLLNILLAWL